MMRRYPAQTTAVFKKESREDQRGCCRHRSRQKGGVAASAPAVARRVATKAFRESQKLPCATGRARRNFITMDTLNLHGTESEE
jgi:hypothetical protein